MYSVQVYYAAEPTPRERHYLQHGAEVLEIIPQLLAQHDACEKIAVYSGPTFLFAVDCRGNRLGA